jgi:hypothetical protein
MAAAATPNKASLLLKDEESFIDDKDVSVAVAGRVVEVEREGTTKAEDSSFIMQTMTATKIAEEKRAMVMFSLSKEVARDWSLVAMSRQGDQLCRSSTTITTTTTTLN